MASQSRISRHEGFGRTLRSGSRAGNRAFVVSVSLAGASAEASETPAQAGVSVAKKQMKLATERNRAKRRVRHVLNRILPGLPQGSRVVVRVLTGASQLSFQEVEQQLTRLVAVARAKEEVLGRG